MMKRWFIPLVLATTPLWAGPLERAHELIGAREYDEARRILEQAGSDPSREGQRLVLLTRVCNELEDYEEGVKYGEQAVELLPQSSEAHLQYAIAIRIKMSKVSKMRAMFSLGEYQDELGKAIELDPENVDAREEEIGYLYNAPGIAGGDKEKAKKLLQKLKAIDARRARLLEADMLTSEDQPEEGIRLLKSLIEEDPEDLEAREHLAFQLQVRERYPEAIDQFAKLATSSDPRYALMAQYQLARSRILGKFEPDKAVEILLAYVKNDPKGGPAVPSRANAYWRLGNAYEQLGELDKAREAYREALTLDANHKEAKKALKNLPR